MPTAEELNKQADMVLAQIKNGRYTTSEEKRRMTQEWRALKQAAVDARKKQIAND